MIKDLACLPDRQGFRIKDVGFFALDFPGFGKSAMPAKDFTVADYAEIVRRFIEKLELKNVILVGHSFGGRVGIKLASKYPGTIDKLVLVDSAGFITHQKKKNLISAMAKFARPFFKPKFMQGLRRKIYRHIGAEDYLATPQLQKTFVNVVSEDLSADMEKILCPTLIIYGENDAETPPEFGRRMQLKIKNCKLEILPKAGHFSFLDQPEEFVGQLEKFVL